MPGQVGQAASAVRQRLVVLLPEPGGERRSVPAAHPDQNRCATGQRPGFGQRGHGRAAPTERGGQPAGDEETLHRRGDHAQVLHALGRRAGFGQVGHGGGAGVQPDLGRDQHAAGLPRPALLRPERRRGGGRGRDRLGGVAGQHGELGDPELSLGGHQRDPGGGELLQAAARGYGRLGQQPKFDQGVRVLVIVIAKRQPGSAEGLRGLVEQAHALGESPGLDRYPGPALGDQSGQGRADPGRRYQRLVQPPPGGPEPALLGLDQGQVARALHLLRCVGFRIGEQALVDDRGVGQLSGIVQQHRPLEVKLDRPRPGDQRRGGVQVAAGRRYLAEFQADGGPAHQRVRQHVLEPATARDLTGLVEQPEGQAVIQQEPFGPGECPQRPGQGLGLIGAPSLRDQCLGGGTEPNRIGRHVVKNPPGTYHQGVGDSVQVKR